MKTCLRACVCVCVLGGGGGGGLWKATCNQKVYLCLSLCSLLLCIHMLSGQLIVLMLCLALMPYGFGMSHFLQHVALLRKHTDKLVMGMRITASPIPLDFEVAR